MNRNLIIGIALAIVLAVGGWFVFSGSGEDATSDDTDTDSALTTDEEGNPVLPDEVYAGPYKLVATTTDTASQADETSFTIIFISDNLWSIETSSDSGTSSIIYSGDYSYVGNEDSGWIRYPADASIGSSLSAYALTNEDLASYAASGYGYQSSESCGLGTCAVWSGSYGGVSSTIRIAADGKIDSLESSTGTSTTTMQYSYPAGLSIEVPADYTDLSSFGETE